MNSTIGDVAINISISLTGAFIIIFLITRILWWKWKIYFPSPRFCRSARTNLEAMKQNIRKILAKPYKRQVTLLGIISIFIWPMFLCLNALLITTTAEIFFPYGTRVNLVGFGEFYSFALVVGILLGLAQSLFFLLFTISMVDAQGPDNRTCSSLVNGRPYFLAVLVRFISSKELTVIFWAGLGITALVMESLGSAYRGYLISINALNPAGNASLIDELMKYNYILSGLLGFIIPMSENSLSTAAFLEFAYPLYERLVRGYHYFALAVINILETLFAFHINPPTVDYGFIGRLHALIMQNRIQSGILYRQTTELKKMTFFHSYAGARLKTLSNVIQEFKDTIAGDAGAWEDELRKLQIESFSRGLNVMPLPERSRLLKNKILSKIVMYSRHLRTIKSHLSDLLGEHKRLTDMIREVDANIHKVEEIRDKARNLLSVLSYKDKIGDILDLLNKPAHNYTTLIPEEVEFLRKSDGIARMEFAAMLEQSHIMLKEMEKEGEDFVNKLEEVLSNLRNGRAGMEISNTEFPSYSQLSDAGSRINEMEAILDRAKKLAELAGRLALETTTTGQRHWGTLKNFAGNFAGNYIEKWIVNKAMVIDK